MLSCLKRTTSLAVAAASVAAMGIAMAPTASAAQNCGPRLQTLFIYNAAPNQGGTAVFKSYQVGDPSTLKTLGSLAYGQSHTWCGIPGWDVVIDADTPGNAWEGTTSFSSQANSTVWLYLYPNPSKAFGYNAYDRNWQFIQVHNG